jgi:hypothetical protein
MESPAKAGLSYSYLLQMANLVAFSPRGPIIPGTFQVGNVAYAISSSIVSGSFNLIWGYEACSLTGYTFISDSYTQSLSPSSSATPIFFTSTTTSSADVLNTINKLPDRVNQTSFTYINTALGWVSGSEKYITLYTCSIYDYPANLLQEDGFYLLQEDNSLIVLNF